MLKRTVSGITLTLVFIGMLTLTFNIQPIKVEPRALIRNNNPTVGDVIGTTGQTVQLVLETDKHVYVLGENVTIILQNIGNKRVEIGGYPAWQIFTYPEEEPVYPMIFAFLAWGLDPGENDTFTWNQYNQFNESFCGPGTYIVRDTQGWNLSTYFKIIVAEIIVPDDYPTIQEAINAANLGDTVSVRNGTYCEHVVVNKSISLIGENPTTTIIDGCETGNVVFLRANNIKISGFTIRNSGTFDWDSGVCVSRSSGNNISFNIITNNYNGIFIHESSKNTLTNNVVTANRVYGVHLWDTSNDTLTDNVVSNNYDGIIIESCSNAILRSNTASGNIWNFGVGGVELSHFVHDIDASNKVEGKSIQFLVNRKDVVIDSSWDVGCLCLVNSTNVTVKDLTLTIGNWHGIKFAYTKDSRIENVTISRTSYAIDFSYSPNNTLINSVISNRMGIRLRDSSGNAIINNSISNTWHAVSFFYSSNNTITNNYINNNGYGIWLYDSSDNKIYHNNFVENTQHIYDSSIECPEYPLSINIWDDGYPSGGNYWSDYAGADLCNGPYQNETGSDGIGDSPYVIDADNRDNYPLMSPWTPTPPVITATVDIYPQTLNLRSRGKWITAFIELPEDYNVADINVSSIMLNDTIPAELRPLAIGDYDEDGIPDLMVKFDRAEVISYIIANVNMTELVEERFMTITLTITGYLYDDTLFQGSDTIRIMKSPPRRGGVRDALLNNPHFFLNLPSDVLLIISYFLTLKH